MAKKYRALVTFGVLAIVLIGAFAGHNFLTARQAQQEQATAAADETTVASETKLMLDDFDATVYTEAGEPLLLSDIADGKPLVINFWATWCPYCVDELPDFQGIYADYGDQVNFAFVDAADGQRERVEDAAAWLAEQGFDDLPSYYDTTQEAAATFGAYALPTTVVVSGEGEILGISSGRIDPTLLRGVLGQLV